MSDRLVPANAIEDAGIDRARAERIATVIFDVIHENVATKADVQGAETRLGAQVAAVRADVTLVGHRLMTRLGALAIVLSGLIVAAIHLWPPY